MMQVCEKCDCILPPCSCESMTVLCSLNNLSFLKDEGMVRRLCPLHGEEGFEIWHKKWSESSDSELRFSCGTPVFKPLCECPGTHPGTWSLAPATFSFTGHYCDECEDQPPIFICSSCGYAADERENSIDTLTTCPERCWEGN